MLASLLRPQRLLKSSESDRLTDSSSSKYRYKESNDILQSSQEELASNTQEEITTSGSI